MSPEFRIFSRGQGDIKMILSCLPKQSPGQILEKYRKYFKIDEKQDETSIETYKNRIIAFQEYLKKAINTMEFQRKQLKIMVKVRAKQDKSSKEFIAHLMRYEDVGIEYYSGKDKDKR